LDQHQKNGNAPYIKRKEKREREREREEEEEEDTSLAIH